MKKFFGSIFIEKEKLEEAGVKYPIKLEYYKIINENEINVQRNETFGIKIVKTQYIKDDIEVEDGIIKYLSSDEKRVEKILSIFKDNEVTPIGMNDIINDFSKNSFFYR